jgi:hypothetical protein
MSIIGWQELECDKCGGKDLFSFIRLQWHEGQGTTARPMGYACLSCHKPVDTAKAIAVLKKKNAEVKIRELEVNLGS